MQADYTYYSTPITKECCFEIVKSRY